MSETNIDQARKAFTKFVENRGKKLITFEGKVTAVNESEGFCDVMPIDGSPEFFDVRLVASTDNVIDGIVPIPKIGSIVFCGRFENENSLFILKTSELSKLVLKISDSGLIELNGNEYSIVKGELLRDEINTLRDDLNGLIDKFNAHTHILTLSSSVTGTAAPTVSVETPTKADFSKILNETVKHGL